MEASVKDHIETKNALTERYQSIRQLTENLCRPLVTEDYVIQSIEDVSPPKWHLAHTTWFFETFILIPHVKSYAVFDTIYHHLFNSYYQTIGSPFPRVRRGVLSRPTVKNIYDYRHYVDQQMHEYLSHLSEDNSENITSLIMLGLHHEQQHQELLLMDIKYNFSCDPTFPAYRLQSPKPVATDKDLTFIELEGGIVTIGHQGTDFCFDNELPSHQQILKPYQLAQRLITNDEYREFIEAGGYQRAEWWLADGWDYIQRNKIVAPLYWYKINDNWQQFTLNGLQAIENSEPVVHVSYYEADAYARFRQMRLPTEAEWEQAALKNIPDLAKGNFLESNYLHPRASEVSASQATQLFGDVWEWTMNAYSPYPGYQSTKGALGEYNGKFMSNQMVLRGGSCVTPRTHIRATYRNFFQPDKRWQFSGIRLAKEK